ncbi:ABC-type nitrate/sulfonate/bicarbonate transport system permease component [Mumia flava]|uniref:ABC-type nitrate/sulfonate/bicarbonate transport system permease component n=1 Tax=Mumia flava TaxID=1348852 RepID=A0A0B2BAK3_9ACTN|nr:ABC transporter permease [Mumia flava]PJJ48224.1 ABC-type nitrate/sulfonate/bicarbonate transport system permease component [Mumia flava]
MTTVATWGRQLFWLLALPLVLLTLWWVASADSTSIFWPPLSTILEAFPQTWDADRIVNDALPSLARLGIGYALALVAGVAGGILVGLSRTVRALCEPSMEFFRAIPPPVLVPVIALFAGYTGSTSKIVTIALGCLWPILLNTVEGVRGLDEVQLDTARVYRFRSRTRLLQVVLRGASPQIAAGARQALSIGVILMVISELFGANRGLGASIVQFQRAFAVPEMWTGIILLGLIGVALAGLFRLVEHRALAWYRGVRRADRGA